MSALLDKLLSHSSTGGTGAVVQQMRQAAQKSVLQYGLPTIADERWKYTSLKLLERREYSKLGAVDKATVIRSAENIIGDSPSAGLVVFAGGHCLLSQAPEWARSLVDVLSDDPEAAEQLLSADELVQAGSSDGFIWLNLARAADGLIIDIPPGVRVEQPLHIVYLDEDNLAWQLRHHWKIAAGSSLTIVEHLCCTGAGLGNIYRSIDLESDSELNWLTMQQAGNEFALLQHNHLLQQQSSSCRQWNLDLGARLSRQETRVSLTEKQANYHYGGLLLGQQRQHRDQQVLVMHDAADCSSRQNYRSVLAGHARGVVNTAARVAAGADGSDVQQNTASMLLSNTAEMDAKPELEIHADEVVASHGATIGQLDEEALFYLRSRGIDQGFAKQMLIAGFVNKIVTGISDAKLAAYAQAQVQQQLEHLL